MMILKRGNLKLTLMTWLMWQKRESYPVLEVNLIVVRDV
tara:strand:- start:1371 stop:1487 length:117 start_codon:yes stop_codon:yes gene_type:complete